MSLEWTLPVETPAALDLPGRLQRVEDKLAVRELVHRWMTLVDHRRWSALADCFDTRVYVDYTGLRPLPPAGWVERESMIAGWKARYDEVIAYQHHIGNFLSAIDGDIARCTGSNVTTHERPTSGSVGTELWHVGVYHRWQLARVGGSWRLTHIAAQKIWERTDRRTPSP